MRLSVGAALLSQGGTSFVLASDDGDAYDAAARWQATGTPIVMTDRLLGKWDAATPLEARWPQGYWLFLAAQYRLFGSAYVSTLILQALLAAGGVLAVFAMAARVLSSVRCRRSLWPRRGHSTSGRACAWAWRGVACLGEQSALG